MKLAELSSALQGLLKNNAPTTGAPTAKSILVELNSLSAGLLVQLTKHTPEDGAPGAPAALRKTALLALSVADALEAAQVQKRSTLSKAELDAYTAFTATLGSMRDMMWNVSDCWRAGSTDKAKEALKLVVSLATNAEALMEEVKALTGGTTPAESAEVAASADAAKACFVVTKAQFDAWAAEQLAQAKATGDEARLAHLASVVDTAKAMSNFGDAALEQPFQFTMVTAYAVLDGKALPLSTTTDQKAETLKLPATSPAATTFSANGVPPTGASPAPAPKLEAEKPAAGDSNFDASGGTSPLGKNTKGWPLDMADSGRKAPPDAIRKADLYWGPDPEGIRLKGPLVETLVVEGGLLGRFTGARGTLAKGSAGLGFEPGATLADGTREVFLTPTGSAPAAIVLMAPREDGSWSIRTTKATLPYVLSAEAVEAGVMPPRGASWLPSSLHEQIPKRLRYWEQKAEAAVAARKALVDSGLASADTVKLVDGVFKIVSVEHHLYVPKDEDGEVVDETTKALREALCGLPAETTVGRTAEVECDLLVVVVETADELSSVTKRTAIVVHPEELTSGLPSGWLSARGSGNLVVSSPFALSSAVEKYEAKAEAEHVVRLLKAEAPEERYVLGVVLEPEVVDAQKDIYSAAEIRSCAHKFLEHFAVLKLMHQGDPINDKVKILESYVSPVDFTVGDQVVKAGTWMLAVRILDDDLWAAAKNGELTGFSIGGHAVKTPEAS